MNPQFHRALHAWYRKHGRRDLPWRVTRDPYAIYVSEVMLQQTQVSTVLERYYGPFLARFPTLKALAAAPLEEVLMAWQGLGYYSRARNLHKAARQTDGALPRTAEELRALPGIGRNTAHAVAALAYHAPLPVMEANVKRVLARLRALENPASAALWDAAAEMLDTQNPFDYNQAMMDLGALVCTPRAPKCPACPAAFLCKGKDAPERYPGHTKAKRVPTRRKRIVLARNDAGALYATPRGTRFLGGMYHFIELSPGVAYVPLGEARYPIARTEKLGAIRQQYSHFTLEAEICLLPAGEQTGPNWHGANVIAALPFSQAERKMLGLLERRLRTVPSCAMKMSA